VLSAPESDFSDASGRFECAPARSHPASLLPLRRVCGQERDAYPSAPPACSWEGNWRHNRALRSLTPESAKWELNVKLLRALGKRNAAARRDDSIGPEWSAGSLDRSGNGPELAGFSCPAKPDQASEWTGIHNEYLIANVKTGARPRDKTGVDRVAIRLPILLLGVNRDPVEVLLICAGKYVVSDPSNVVTARRADARR